MGLCLRHGGFQRLFWGAPRNLTKQIPAKRTDQCLGLIPELFHGRAIG